MAKDMDKLMEWLNSDEHQLQLDKFQAQQMGISVEEYQAQRKAWKEEPFTKGDYNAYLVFRDSYDRFDGLLRCEEAIREGAHGKQEADFARLFYENYTNTDGALSGQDKKHMHVTRILKEYAWAWMDVIDDDDRQLTSETIKGKEKVTVYRGTHMNNPLRASWTLDEKVAEMFAWHYIRYGGQNPERMRVIKTDIPVDAIYYISNGRSEMEVMVDIFKINRSAIDIRNKGEKYYTPWRYTK